MKFTLGWLKDHLDTDASLDRIVETLTAIGLEVESVEDPSAALAPFTIARVLTAAPHPQADKLQVLSVDTGSGDPVQVVCGAPNARAGLVGVFGAPGAYVPGSDITLKVASIRGVESRGMMCSERELLLSDEHNGIIELSPDAPVGARYIDYASLADPLIEVAVTPNRQDCMGVAGIARDLAAAGLGSLKTPLVELVEGDFDCPIAIATEDPAGCPIFLGRVVRGVRNGASPDWMQKRLRAIGQKPISALVDITNYIMFDRGRPLHVYDLGKLAGRLVARRARDGESVLALNGKTYALDSSMTVIADDAHVHDIGGIMGGIDSGVSEATTDIVIECACFAPDRIGATGRALNIVSDARARFERGVDPGFLDAGMALATQMVLSLCGGTPSRVTVAGEAPSLGKVVRYDPRSVERIAGVVIETARQSDILVRLGFHIDETDPWSVAVPSWRIDIDGEADLVEEIVRIEGLHHVASVALPRAEGVARPTATPQQRIERRLRRAAAASGLNEAVTWSFIAPQEAQHFGGSPWTLANPISAEMAAMRPSLLPGLLAAARRNLDRGQPGVRLFELGRRYLADAERPTLAILLAGEATPRHWRSGAARGYDAFDVKALVEALLAAADAPVERLILLDAVDGWYHPGRSGRLCLGPKQPLAAFGQLHPATANAFGLRGDVMAAELYLDALPQPRAQSRTRPAFAAQPLQPVTRDFAFVVDRDVRAEALLRAVRGADKTAIVAVDLFDRFDGGGIGDGKVSLAVGVTFQPTERSFTEAELDALSAAIVAAAAKATGAVLRG